MPTLGSRKYKRYILSLLYAIYKFRMDHYSILSSRRYNCCILCTYTIYSVLTCAGHCSITDILCTLHLFTVCNNYSITITLLIIIQFISLLSCRRYNSCILCSYTICSVFTCSAHYSVTVISTLFTYTVCKPLNIFIQLQ